ncbi:MAG: PIN domain-containing protein [Chloroflexi bacterium]|nr:PIN domain-containing protein [Chloroflexota bacterium]
MKALIDTNVVLDDVLAREPFASDAREIVEACAHEDYTGYISAMTPLNAFYVARRLMGTEPAREMVGRLLQLFEVCPLDRDALQAAYESGQADLEDAAQVAAAVAMGVDVIVTRDTRGFADAPVRTLTTGAFLAELRLS